MCLFLLYKLYAILCLHMIIRAVCVASRMEQLMRGLGQGGLGGMQVHLLAFSLFQ